MITLIISTPRTGSNTFAKSLNGEIWIPEGHPGYNKHYELFNFTPLVNTYNLSLLYYSMLLDYISENPTKNIIVKVLVDTVSPHILNSLIKKSTIIYHTVRIDYISQLKSLICARKQNKWLERYSSSAISITQDDIDDNHVYLSNVIKTHSVIYLKCGGQIYPLENREYAPYMPLTVVGENLVWPSFSTKEYFK
jgi:hypothetical protein